MRVPSPVLLILSLFPVPACPMPCDISIPIPSYTYMFCADSTDSAFAVMFCLPFVYSFYTLLNPGNPSLSSSTPSSQLAAN